MSIVFCSGAIFYLKKYGLGFADFENTNKLIADYLQYNSEQTSNVCENESIKTRIVSARLVIVVLANQGVHFYLTNNL